MQDKEEIVGLLGRYNAAVNAGDSDSVAELYSPGATLLPEGFPVAAGGDAIRRFYAGVFSQLRIDISIDVDKDSIEVQGDVGFVATSSTGTRRYSATGETVPENNRELWVFRKHDESWKIERYMFNKSAPS